ncbi:MAG: efflux RND transporter permease subunit [Bacteroidales bacterium]
MVRFLISRPIAVMMTFTAAVILGLIANRAIPVSLMPDIPIPEVTVTVSYPNSTARELENTIVRPLRAQVMQTGHLSELRSETRDGSATLTLRFDYGTNVDYAFVEVNEKIDAIMTSMPRDMKRPGVIKASATDIPVFYLNLSLRETEKEKGGEETIRFMELSEFAETVIRKRIEQLPEVALVDISGTVLPQVVIEPVPELMKNMRLSLRDIEAALAENNISAGTMTVRDGHYRYNIRLSSLLRNQNDVADIRLSAGNRIIRLSEIARVNLISERSDGLFMADGHRAITMAVIKQADARIAGMKNKIRELVSQFESDYPGIAFKVSQDQTRLLDYSISNLKSNLLQGLVLVILVVVFFIHDIRLPLLLGFSLMVSVIISLLFFYLAGMSVNIISLAGLILAAGNMMDNSIVVTDNITQYRERGLALSDACVTGTNEVLLPQLSSMLVNVAVFVPLVFLSGIAGALMKDEAMAVLIGLSVSYIVGITFMPVIYRLTYSSISRGRGLFPALRRKFLQLKKRPERSETKTERFYERGLDFVFRYKTVCIILFLLMIPSGILVLRFLEKEKMPQFSQVETIVYIEWNENIDPAENRMRVEELLASTDDKIIQSNAFIGKQQFMLSLDRILSPSEARLYLECASRGDLTLMIDKIRARLRSDYPMATVTFEPPVNIFEKLFTRNESPLVAELTMKNSALEPDLPALEDLNVLLNRDPELRASNRIPLQEHLIIEPDMEKLLLYDVDYNDLIKVIRTGLYENKAATLRSFTRFIPVVLKGEEASLYEVLEGSRVRNRRGTEISVKSLITLSRSQDLKTIVAGRQGEYVPLKFYPERRELDQFIDHIGKKVEQSSLFEVRYSGTLFSDIKLLKEMVMLLLISLLLLYFILAAQFESLVQPLLVLAEIPADISAALFTLLIAGQTLNIMSAIGIIVMTGIIITDSILKIDAFNKLRKEGYSLDEAIREGGHRRFRAIIMTALTSILAVLPLLFTNDLGSELQKPFSYALIGGMIMGTFISLFILPLIYRMIYRNTLPVRKI